METVKKELFIFFSFAFMDKQYANGNQIVISELNLSRMRV